MVCSIWVTRADAQESAPMVQILTHDVEVSDFLVPSPNSRTPVGYATPVMVEFRNVGSSTENGVKLYMRIYDGKMQRIYSDSVTMNNWLSGEVRDTTFKDFLPQLAQTTFTMIAFTALANDQYRYNDTLQTRVSSKYLSDSKAVAVLVPSPDTTIEQHSSFSPVGSFQTLGVQDMYDMPIRVEIHRCSDGVVVFRADTTADALYGDSAAKPFRFPAAQGSNDTRKLVPGCYRIAVIARQGDDGDRTDDTAYSYFSVAGVVDTTHVKTHDLAVTRIYAPKEQQQFLMSTSVIPTVSVFNYGSSTETSVLVVGLVKDAYGTIVWRDTVTVAAINSGTSVDASFKSYQPTVLYMPYTFRAYPVVAGDLITADDTLSVHFTTRPYQDESVSLILYPPKDMVLVTKQRFKPTVLCGFITGEKPTSPIQLTAIFYRAGVFSYSAYVSLPASYYDSSSFAYTFPTSLADHLAALDSGEYQLCIAANFHDDNPLNDSAWTSFYVRRGHDLRADSIMVGDALDRLKVGVASPLKARFTNVGMLNESNAKVSIAIYRGDSVEVYHDTERVALWNAGTSLVLPFKDFTPDNPGSYSVIARAVLASDENSVNDAIKRLVVGRFANDVAAEELWINYPADSIPYGSDIRITGVFGIQGMESPSMYPVRAELHSCSSGALAFRVDTVIDVSDPTIMLDTIPFPMEQSLYSTRTVAPGCYRLYVIARSGIDQNRANDTVEMPITILSGTSETHAGLPLTFSLSPNFPNPFDRQTSLRYTLPLDAVVRITVRDLLGRVVFGNNGGVETVGEHITVLNMNSIPEGAYVVTLTATEASGLTHVASRTVTLVHQAK